MRWRGCSCRAGGRGATQCECRRLDVSRSLGCPPKRGTSELGWTVVSNPWEINSEHRSITRTCRSAHERRAVPEGRTLGHGRQAGRAGVLPDALTLTVAQSGRQARPSPALSAFGMHCIAARIVALIVASLRGCEGWAGTTPGSRRRGLRGPGRRRSMLEAGRQMLAPSLLNFGGGEHAKGHGSTCSAGQREAASAFVASTVPERLGSCHRRSPRAQAGFST